MQWMSRYGSGSIGKWHVIVYLNVLDRIGCSMKVRDNDLDTEHFMVPCLAPCLCLGIYICMMLSHSIRLRKEISPLVMGIIER